MKILLSADYRKHQAGHFVKGKIWLQKNFPFYCINRAEQSTAASNFQAVCLLDRKKGRRAPLRQSQIITILDAHQIESIGIKSGSSSRTLSGFKNILEPARLFPADADLHQRAYDIAHHVLQEGIGLDLYADESSEAAHLQAVYRAHGRSCLALGSAKT